jgi:hypothetical protein
VLRIVTPSHEQPSALIACWPRTPIENSESREFDQRILFDLPLVVTFVVDFEHSEITVIDVRCVS